MTMTHSLAEPIKILAESLPPALISPAHAEQIAAVAGHLPGAVTHFYGFECHLGQAAAQADLALSLNRTGRDSLLTESSRAFLAPALQSETSWERLWAFCALWADRADSRRKLKNT